MGTPNRSRLERLIVAEEEAGLRVDRFLASRLGISRGWAQRLLKSGEVQVAGGVTESSRRLRPGEEVVVSWPGPEILPTPFPISILYEDEHLVVVNKPRGMPVHPLGHEERPTVVSCLLARGPLAGGDPKRPGVVHRLDAATTGALVLARTASAHRSLVAQFKARRVLKEYLAVVEGEIEVDEGVIEGRVGRAPHEPWRMEVRHEGKEARTEFAVLRREGGRSFLLVRPVTGRTHQIRLHLGAIGHAVVGDPLYGKGEGPLLLHSWKLGFIHPESGEWQEFLAPPPPEFSAWIGDIDNS